MAFVRTKKLTNLVMGFDENYLIPFLVAIYSALKTTDYEFKLTIVTTPDGLSGDSRKLVTECLSTLGMTKFDFLDLNLPKTLPTRLHLNESAYARLWCAQAIGEDFVWLDSDTVCCSGWDIIFSTEFQRRPLAPLAAVTSVYNADDAAPGNQAVGARYFNSGVMAVNSKVFGSERFMAQIFDALNRYEELGFEWADQDVLNYVIGGNQKDLDPALNCFDERVIEHPLIYHFAGAAKPWLPKSLTPELFVSLGAAYSRWISSAKGLAESLSSPERSTGVARIVKELRRVKKPPVTYLHLIDFSRKLKNFAKEISGI